VNGAKNGVDGGGDDAQAPTVSFFLEVLIT